MQNAQQNWDHAMKARQPKGGHEAANIELFHCSIVYTVATAVLVVSDVILPLKYILGYLTVFFNQ